MYGLTREYLQQWGYERYEISNYAKEGMECKHNIGYWQRVNYVGFGIGAASLIENKRFSNSRDLKKYIGNPIEQRVEEQVLSREEQMEEMMFLGLRMCEGVCYRRFEGIFGVTIENVYDAVIEKHIKNGLLEIIEKEQKGKFLRLTEKGMDLCNYVMADFLEPEIQELQKKLNCETDRAEAHKLLKEAVELNEKDYRSLFHIGCDYLVGSSRTGNKVDRNPYLARDYFVKALRLAKASKDSVLYKSMIEPKLKRIEQMNYGK